MKAALALLPLLLLGANEPEPMPNVPWADAIPPARLHATGFVPVLYVPPAEVEATCGIVPEEGYRVVACTRPIAPDDPRRIVIMPDPCAFAEVDYYAAIQCHENSHFLSNWRHEPW